MSRSPASAPPAGLGHGGVDRGADEPSRRDPNALDVEALTVAMALAPGVYSRNRHFTLYSNPSMRRARARAALLRGLVRQLLGAEGPLDGMEIQRSPAHLRLRYRLAHLRLDRTADLTAVEAACVFHLATRAGAPGFTLGAEDHARLLSALRRLRPSAEDAMTSE